MRWGPLIAALAVVLAACAQAPQPAPPAARQAVYEYPEAPAAPADPLEPEAAAALDRLLAAVGQGGADVESLEASLEAVAASGDPRLAWLVADLLRFTFGGDAERSLTAAFTRLTGADPARDPAFGDSAWKSVTDHLIAWDLPAPPGYRERKASLFLLVEPGWEPFFADPDAAIDWRLVSWGGVGIDDRPEGDPAPCPGGCIPALDDPALTAAAGAGWLADERPVFGVVSGGEAVAFPKNIMEVHELVNLTVGGRRLGIPYCTLCGSAQAYYTDAGPAAGTVLRTSGLLSRSNKVMYDLRTKSVFDTFTGEALSGPLQDAGVVLEQVTVVASTWGAWRAAHPGTRVVAEDGGIGRTYPADPLGGRDDDGPIFPTGPVDPRLPAQARVLGVIAPDGTPIAFPADEARAALAAERAVGLRDVEVIADGGGLRARRPGSGGELPAHESFWFAWSQFHRGTLIWREDPPRR